MIFVNITEEMHNWLLALPADSYTVESSTVWGFESNITFVDVTDEIAFRLTFVIEPVRERGAFFCPYIPIEYINFKNAIDDDKN